MDGIKKNLLYAACLIGMLALGSAYDVVVSSEQEAIAALSVHSNVVQSAGCTIISAEKQVATIGQVGTNPISITFKLDYAINGSPAQKVKTIRVASENAVQSAVQAECEKLWVELKPAKENEPRTATIRYDSFTGMVYDLLLKKWA